MNKARSFSGSHIKNIIVLPFLVTYFFIIYLTPFLYALLLLWSTSNNSQFSLLHILILILTGSFFSTINFFFFRFANKNSSLKIPRFLYTTILGAALSIYILKEFYSTFTFLFEASNSILPFAYHITTQISVFYGLTMVWLFLPLGLATLITYLLTRKFPTLVKHSAHVLIGSLIVLCSVTGPQIMILQKEIPIIIEPLIPLVIGSMPVIWTYQIFILPFKSLLPASWKE